MGDATSEPWCYEEDLIAYAGFLCRHTDDAEDIAHTALLKAAEHMTDFRGEASMRTWLHTIVTNECRMLARRTASLSVLAPDLVVYTRLRMWPCTDIRSSPTDCLRS